MLWLVRAAIRLHVESVLGSTVGDMSPMPTGLTDLDRATAGGAPGALWVMSGPPGTPVARMALTAARGCWSSAFGLVGLRRRSRPG
jgi:replicative DNA helicase